MDAIWLVKAIYQEDFKIHLTFNDGTTGIADLTSHLDGSVFEPLKDPAYFRNFQLNEWTICWPNGADMAPEFLYHLLTLRATAG